MNPQTQPRSGLRVLVVEDEMMIAFLAESMLTEMGHVVAGPVADFHQGLQMAQQVSVDVALLDVNLDGQEVYPIAATLTARRIPIIFATGHGKIAVQERFRGTPVLQKPYRSEDLQAAIAKVCGSEGH